jgi:hypothetical protein
LFFGSFIKFRTFVGSYCRVRHRQDRRDHAITVHSFPPDFRFDESKKPQRNGGSGGSDRKQQQQRPMKAIKKHETGQEKTVPQPPPAANGGGVTDGGGGMEVDGDIGVGSSGVAFRRDSGARRPLSLARLVRSHWPV